MKKLLLLLTVLLTGVGGAWAERTVTVGSQVTTEGALVSGRAYILESQASASNSTVPFIQDAGTYYAIPNNNKATTKCVYYLISNGDGTWKIKNYETNKYWGVPVYNTALAPAEEASAGAWSLNFKEGIAYPSAPDAGKTVRGLDRSNSKLWGYSTGTGGTKQVKIYEVGAYNTVNDDLKGKILEVGDAVSSFTTNTWYVIKCNTPVDAGYYRGTIFENPGALYHNGNTSVDLSTKWVFRFEDAGETDKYYIKTACDNYVTDFTNDAQIGTRTPINGKEKITIAKINSTDGHFYFQSSTSGVIMDANGLASGVASGNVVGYGDTPPAATGGNNDWGIYSVTLTEPTASEIYTINNTNASRGAMMYYPSGSTKYVWSSGKGSASFDASSDNCRWIIYPTGTTGQYYLYNVGAQKFAVYGKDSYYWTFSSDAVPVSLNQQGDGTYKFITAVGSVNCAVSNDYDGPIINYDDDGGMFTLTRVAEASSSVTTALTAAVNKLIDSQTALTAKPASDGWYAIKVKSCTNDASYANNYVYTLATEYNNSGTYYPLHHINQVKLRPAIDDALYYFYITQSGSYYMIQMPNGRRIRTDGTYFPLSSVNGTTVDIQYDAGGFFRFTASSKYADAYANFIGETGTKDRTKYDIYPINLTTAGLTAWAVTIGSSTGVEKLNCTHADASGLTSVYNNGYIFLPTGTTPTASDFSVTGGSYDYQITVDAGEKTITATPGHYITMNKVGSEAWATLSLTYDATIPGQLKTGGAAVYTVSIAGDRARLEGTYTMSHANGVNEIPANTGVLLHAAAPIDAPTIFATKAATALSDPISNDGNALKPNASEKTSLEDNEYVFGTSSGELGFWKLGDGKKLAANKAYLLVPGGSVKGYAIDFNDVVGINAVDNGQPASDNVEIYNLAGQRMSRVQKGVIIINGKKILVK